MRRLLFIAMAAAAVAFAACSGGNDKRDRTKARDMFFEISALTEKYTDRVAAACDSIEWAYLCVQFEDSLEKINFSYPADTDLLLSEGQNDTIARLTQAYITARDERISAILHPAVPMDSVSADSISTGPSLNASRSLGS